MNLNFIQTYRSAYFNAGLFVYAMQEMAAALCFKHYTWLLFSLGSCAVDLCQHIYSLPLPFRLSSVIVQLPFNVQ